MKKIGSRKLTLEKQTIRELTGELADVRGGTLVVVRTNDCVMSGSAA